MARRMLIAVSATLLLIAGFVAAGMATEAAIDGYVILDGNGLARNLVVGERNTATNKCFYILNPCWWPIRSGITLKDKSEIVDLDSGKRVKTRWHTLNLKLGPYDLRRFVTSPGNHIMSAKTTIKSEKALEYFSGRLDLFDDAASISAAELTMARDILGVDESLLRCGVKELRGAYVQNDFLTAQQLLRLRVMERWADYLNERRARQKLGEGLIPLEPLSVCRVNCGSARPRKDKRGIAWSADQVLSEHEFIMGVQCWGAVGGKMSDRGPIEISATVDDQLYQSERFEMSKYLFRMRPGAYCVRMHFSEGWKKAWGRLKRAFDVTVNNEKVLSDFEIYAEAGAGKKAVARECWIETDTGIVEMRFDWTGGIPAMINGIEIEPWIGKLDLDQ